MRCRTGTFTMGEGACSSTGQDWTYEGCGWNILAPRNPWKQSKTGARQRYCAISPCCHASKLYAIQRFSACLTMNHRHVFHTTSRSAQVEASRIAYITLSSFSKIPHTLCTVSLSVFGLVRTRSVLRPSATCESELNPTFSTTQTRHTGSLTALVSSPGIPCTTF
jgi:hypothetical protein